MSVLLQATKSSCLLLFKMPYCIYFVSLNNIDKEKGNWHPEHDIGRLSFLKKTELVILSTSKIFPCSLYVERCFAFSFLLIYQDM